MKKIAWIGSIKTFRQTFHTHRNFYVDENAGIKYINIATPQDLLGRRFDDIQQNYGLTEYGCWNELYEEAQRRIRR